MTASIVKFCSVALAGSLIGISYERWSQQLAANQQHQQSPSWWPNKPAFNSVLADSSSLVPRDSSYYDSKGNIVPIDAKISAENFVQSSRFGLPSRDNLRIFNDFILSYDRRLRAPNWVIEHMTPEKLALKNASRQKSDFVEDSSLHEYFRATLQDFRGSKYDRGHMAAAGNHKTSQDAMDQTFILSNISPQEPKFNQGAWERLESYVRFRANRSKNLYVVTGPLYLPQQGKDGNTYVIYRVIGQNVVSVPTHYFKVILIESKEGKLIMESFVMPNDARMDSKVQLDKYRVFIDQLDTIERASGSIFFDQVSREKVEKPTKLPSDFKERPRLPSTTSNAKTPLAPGA